MAEKKKISMAMLANDYQCPDELKEAEDNYKPIDDVIGQEIEIMAFVFITSQNTEKYNQDNAKGVFFMFKIGDELARTSTHSKKIVKGFEALEKAMGTNILEAPIVTKLVKKATANGRTMFDFEF